MFRPARINAAGFKMPAPMNAMSGDNAPLQVDGVFPYSALLQVAAEDTEDNYVYCRGFDPRIAKFIEYESGNADKPGIPAGKPYGKRRPGAYNIAEVFQALLPLQTTNPSPATVDWRIRQNPGFAVGGEGHPQSLDEKIDELYTNEGKLVNYMLVDSVDVQHTVLFKIDSVEISNCKVIGEVLGRPCGLDEVEDEVDGKIDIYGPACCNLDEPDEDLIGRLGWATRIELDPTYNECCDHPLEECIWSVVTLCCPTCEVSTFSGRSSSGEPAAMITGFGPGPIPGQFLP